MTGVLGVEACWRRPPLPPRPLSTASLQPSCACLVVDNSHNQTDTLKTPVPSQPMLLFLSLCPCVSQQPPNSGEPIPRISYTPEETWVWGTALSKLKALFSTHACREFNKSFPKFNFRCEPAPHIRAAWQQLSSACLQAVLAATSAACNRQLPFTAIPSAACWVMLQGG